MEGTDRITLGADKGYDTKDFVKEMRGMNVTPHVSQNTKRPGGSAIDGRTTRHEGYQVSQRKPSASKKSLAGSKRLERYARPGIAD